MQIRRGMIGEHKKTIGAILFILILITAITLRVYRIGAPWNGDHDSAGATLGNAAYFYSTYGLCKTGPLLIKNELKSGDSITFDYYINHPPVEVLIISLSYDLFGKSEASTRLVPIIFSILSVILVFLICSRFFTNRVALLAALFMAVNPLDAYYGCLPHFFEAAKAFILLTLFLYFLWEEKGGRSLAFLVVLSLFCGLAVDWPVYFLPPALLLYELFKRGKRNLLFPVFLNLFSVFVFVLFLLVIIGTIGKESFYHLFSFYRDTEVSSGTSLWDFVSANAYKIVIDFSIAWIILIGLWALTNLADTVKGTPSSVEQAQRRWGIIFILFFIGAMNIVLFPSHSIVHRYWLDLLSPFFAILGGYCADAVCSSRRKKRWHTAVVTLLVILFVVQSIFVYIRRSHQHNYFPLTIEMADAVNKSIENKDNILFITPLMVSDDIYRFYTDSRIVRIHNVPDLYDLLTTSPYPNFRFVTMDRDTAKSMNPFVGGLSASDLESWGFYPKNDDPFLTSGLIINEKRVGGFSIYQINTELLNNPR